jgi:hypothetical protein
VDPNGSPFPPASIFGSSAPAAPFAVSAFPNSEDGLPGLMAAATAIAANDPTPTAPPQIGETNGNASRRPVRYLGRIVAGRQQGPAFDTTAPRASFANSDQPIDSDGQETFADRFGNWTATPTGTTPAAPSPSQTERPFGIFTGKPMPDWPVPPPIFDFGDNRGQQDSGRVSFPLLDQYIRHLNRAYGG